MCEGKLLEKKKISVYFPSQKFPLNPLFLPQDVTCLHHWWNL